MTFATTSARELAAHVDLLGVGPGDNILVHSRLLSFGRIEGQAAAVHDVLRAAIGSEGTLVVPAYTLYLADDAIFDRETTPSHNVGVLPEFIRKLPGARRSASPFHSHVALGPLSETIAASDGRVSLGAGSDFERMHELGFKMVFLGCQLREAATFTFHVQALVGVPFRQWFARERMVRFPDGHVDRFRCNYYGRIDRSRKEELMPIETAAIDSGLTRRIPCPLGTSCSVPMREYQELVIGMLKQNPLVTLAPPVEAVAGN